MKRNVLVSTALCAALASGVPVASAQQATAEHVQDLIRAAAERVGVAQTGTGSTAAPQAAGAADARQTVQLTLDDAMKLALERNLDIAVQRLNPQTFDYLDREPASRSTSPTLTSQVITWRTPTRQRRRSRARRPAPASSRTPIELQRRGCAEHSLGRRSARRRS